VPQRGLQIANYLSDICARCGPPRELPSLAQWQQSFQNIGAVPAWTCNGSRNAQCIRRVGLRSHRVTLCQSKSGERWQEDLEQRDISFFR
jgi:hypothetical protein